MTDEVAEQNETVFDYLAELPSDELEDFLRRLEQGEVEKPADIAGFSPEALNTIESIAYGHYRVKRYGEALSVYRFIAEMDPTRLSAVRGLGACLQGMKQIDAALLAYFAAARLDPEDLVSQALLGEAFCLTQRIEPGLICLERVLKMTPVSTIENTYVARAKAIIAAKGGRPPTLLVKRKTAEGVEEAHAAWRERGVDDEAFQYNSDEELLWKDAKKHPELRGKVAQLNQWVVEGRITYADIAGFSESQMDGMYKLCVDYVAQEKFGLAARIMGAILMLDSESARFHKLQGIVMHRLRVWSPAEFHYEAAHIYDPSDFESLVYLAEVHLANGEVDEGLEVLERAKKGAEKLNQIRVIERANKILERFSD